MRNKKTHHNELNPTLISVRTIRFGLSSKRMSKSFSNCFFILSFGSFFAMFTFFGGERLPL